MAGRQHLARLCIEEFDALHAKMSETAGAEERGKIAIDSSTT